LCYSFNRYSNHLDLHSFPTRRSSDLKSCARIAELERQVGELTRQLQQLQERLRAAVEITPALQKQYACTAQALGVSLAAARELRSEEHTSELQSRVDLVCRLLLEKKN